MNNIGIEFLPINGSIKLGGEKVIALNQTNIESIKGSYSKDSNVIAAQNAISNKDLLSQSFGGGPISPTPEISNNPINSSQSNLFGNGQDLEVSAANMNTIPSADNINFDTVSPVQNMNFSLPGETSINSVSNTNNLDVSVPDVTISNSNGSVIPEQKIDDNVVLNMSNQNVSSSLPNGAVAQELTVPTVNIPEVSGISIENNDINNNEFKVSSAPNIFDLPSVNENSSNSEKSLNNEVIPEITLPSNPLDTNFEKPTLVTPVESPIIPSVSELKETPVVTPSVDAEQNFEVTNELNDDILEARIAIEKSNYRLYMSLAENSKKMAELLEKQKKTVSKETNLDNTNLENTASNLFNLNGQLDENKVLGLGIAA